MVNMKVAFLILNILVSVTVITGQATSSAVEIITTYSQNGQFYLRSVPYDNEFPTTRGKTSVYEKGNPTPLYVFERGFDSVDDDSNNLILSNNGEVIFHVIAWGADEEKEGLKSITIYKKGKIFRSFTEAEITGCDKKKERCSLVYSNYDEVVDREKSNWGTANYKKAFKEGVSEKEKFLSDFPVFSYDDTVYLTDSKKKTHLFDLKEGNSISSHSFDDVFEQIKNKGRFNKTELQRFDAPIFSDFPKLRNGRDSYQTLAAHIGMKSASIFEEKDEQYKLYSFKINSVISQDGSLAIEDIEFYDELPKEKIIEFFKINKFDSSSIPEVFDKWHISNEYFYFRKIDDRVAKQEKQQEITEARKELERRMTLESINGVYIPKDLGECFVELDKLLSEIDKKEMQSLSKRGDMIRYHHGLGMWIRNNWGLWGGSRLQKYFTDKGITHPDKMSSIILEYYHDWLNGKKETWKDWEKNPNSR
jgi:hypothetical protein